MIKRLFYTVDLVKKVNPNKSKFVILLNVVYSVFRYGLSFADYRKANFINLSREEKKQVLGMKEYRHVQKYLNNPKYTAVFLDKILFNNVFKDYIKRDFLDIRNASIKEIEEFIKGKKDFFAKKHNSCGGDGVERIVNKNLDVKALYKRLMDNKQYLLEESITQHDYLQKINHIAVNNIRIITLLKDGVVYPIELALRLTDGEEEVVSCHDITITLNEKGEAIGPAYDDEFNHFPKHPTTGYDLSKIKIPFMKEAIDMAKQGALLVPEVRYIGWDIAITPNGPCVIEGNFFPSIGPHQFYLIKKDYFFKKQLKDVLKEEYNEIK